MRRAFNCRFQDLKCVHYFLKTNPKRFEFRIVKILMRWLSPLTFKAMSIQFILRLGTHKFQAQFSSMNRFYTFLGYEKNTENFIIWWKFFVNWIFVFCHLFYLRQYLVNGNTFYPLSCWHFSFDSQVLFIDRSFFLLFEFENKLYIIKKS